MQVTGYRPIFVQYFRIHLFLHLRTRQSHIYNIQVTPVIQCNLTLGVLKSDFIRATIIIFDVFLTGD